MSEYRFDKPVTIASMRGVFAVHSLIIKNEMLEVTLRIKDIAAEVTRQDAVIILTISRADSDKFRIGQEFTMNMDEVSYVPL